MAVLVDLQKVTVRRSDRTLFEDLSLTVTDGDRIGIVGINGTGKSTLLRVLAGVDNPEGGQVRRGRGARVEFLDQDPKLPAGTVGEAAGEGWEAEAALERLGMGHAASIEVAELSGGQAKRVALAGILARPAELLVLDEPTNHLDLGAVSWLERKLSSFKGAIVLVSHDRHLLDRVTTRMVELDRGRSYVHEGGYSSYLQGKMEREENAAAAEQVRRNLARRELAWLRRGAPARTRKPQARIDAATKIVEGRAEAPARSQELEIKFGTPRLGDKVIELQDVSYRYGEKADPVLSGVDLNLDPRERLGIVGGNGTGKSTLLDIMAGRKKPASGKLELGPTVVTGYYDQRGVKLDPQERVRDLVAGPTRPAGSPEDVALMEQFWFTGELPHARVGTLSGGERRRLQLLLVLAGRPNVLLLDEPTNDLDLDTLRILEDFFEDWPGALVVVSHDRTFLNRTTERIVATAEGGKVAPVVGGLDAWVAKAESEGAMGSRGEAAGSRAASGRSGSAGSAGAGLSGAAPGMAAGSSKLKKSGSGGLLREIEKEISRLQRKRDQLHLKLAGTTDHVRLNELGSELSTLQKEIEGAEERWLEVAEDSESG